MMVVPAYTPQYEAVLLYDEPKLNIEYDERADLWDIDPADLEIENVERPTAQLEDPVAAEDENPHDYFGGPEPADSEIENAELPTFLPEEPAAAENEDPYDFFRIGPAEPEVGEPVEEKY
jgi:hypothetical protein